MGLNPKFYILNSINNQKENSISGGVEAIIKKSHIVRLSNSPSQGFSSSLCEQESMKQGSNLKSHPHNNSEYDLVHNSTSGNDIESKIGVPNFWDSFKLYLKGI
jgi:hypothetical protein